MTTDVRFTGLPTDVDVGDGITLRVLTEHDVATVVEVVNASLDSLRPWMEWAQQPATLERQLEWYQESVRTWADGTGFHWGVFVGDELAGGAGFHVRNGPGVLEIGYWLAPAHQGRGVMTQVARALTEVARRVDGCVRVEIHTDVGNVKSAAVPQRLGYTLADVREVERLAPAHTGRHQIWALEL